MTSNNLSYNLSYNSNLMIKFYNMILKYYKNFKIIENNSKNSNYERFHSYIYKKLNNIYNTIKLDYNNFNYAIYRTIVDNNTNIYNNTLTNIYEKYLLHNRYVSNNIKDFIKNEKTKNSSKLLIYKLPYKNTYIHINFFTYNERIDNNNINTNYDKSVTNILLLINLIVLLSGNNYIHNTNNNNDICSKNGLNITFFNTPFLRTLNDDVNNVLGAKNVNGGFCFGCQNVGNIIIYRKEECFKVFTHELIHNMGIDQYFFDFMNLAKNKQCNEYKIYKSFIKNYNISKEININDNNIGLQECFVEFWGEFFNNVLTSFLYANSCTLSNNINKFKIYKNIFTKIIQFEYIHNYYQVYKILNFNNMSYNDLIIKNVKNINYDNIVYNNFREHTHIFSYYILKLFLLIDYEGFINSSISLSIIDNIYNINFLQNSNNMDNFFKFLLANSHNTKTLKNFEILEELFQSILQSYNATQCNSLEFIIKNLRMSILERIN